MEALCGDTGQRRSRPDTALQGSRKPRAGPSAVAQLVVAVICAAALAGLALEARSVSGTSDDVLSVSGQVHVLREAGDTGAGGEADELVFPGPTDIDFVDEREYLGSLPPPYNANANRSSLPRTSRRAYNVLEEGKQYVLYSPSGGFNNQLICLMDAIYLARKFKRAVIVPPAGRHSSLHWNYYKLTGQQVIPMDHALDFEYMERALQVELVPLNVTLREFRESEQFLGLSSENKSSAQVDYIPIPHDVKLRLAPLRTVNKFERLGRESTKQVVFYYGAFFNRVWLSKQTQAGVRYSPYIRMFSQAVSRRLFRGRFNALHVRLGDKFEVAHKLSKNAEPFVDTAGQAGFLSNQPVFVASDEVKDSRYMRPIKAHFRNVTFGVELKRLPSLRDWFDDYHSRLPRSQIRRDMFGLVEQLVCVRAERFVGTALSSFTETIVFSRGLLSVTVPDMIGNDLTAPALQGSASRGYERKRVTAVILWNGKVMLMRRDRRPPRI